MSNYVPLSNRAYKYNCASDLFVVSVGSGSYYFLIYYVGYKQSLYCALLMSFAYLQDVITY